MSVSGAAAIASAVGSAVGAGGGILGSIISGAQNKKARELQQEMYEEQFQYAKEQDILRMIREDNAIQRQMEDMQAAGINPLYAASMGGASALAGGTLPGMYTPAQSDVGQIIANTGTNLQRSLQDYAELKEQTRVNTSRIELTEQQKELLKTQEESIAWRIPNEKDKQDYWKTMRSMNEYERWNIAKLVDEVTASTIGYAKRMAEKTENEDEKKRLNDLIAKAESGDVNDSAEAMKDLFKSQMKNEGFTEAIKNEVETLRLNLSNSQFGEALKKGGEIISALLGKGGGEFMIDLAREERQQRQSNYNPDYGD